MKIFSIIIVNDIKKKGRHSLRSLQKETFIVLMRKREKHSLEN